MQNERKLESDYSEVLEKMATRKAEMRKQKSKYDPLNDTAVSHMSGIRQMANEIHSEREDSTDLEDEHLRKVLDSIDIKIGQSIEEKEQDGIKINRIIRDIKEAKDSFTNAYKSYKALKQSKNYKKKKTLSTQQKSHPNFKPYQPLNIQPKPQVIKKRVLQDEHVFIIDQGKNQFEDDEKDSSQPSQNRVEHMSSFKYQNGPGGDVSASQPAPVFASERKPNHYENFLSFSQNSCITPQKDAFAGSISNQSLSSMIAQNTKIKVNPEHRERGRSKSQDTSRGRSSHTNWKGNHETQFEQQ